MPEPPHLLHPAPKSVRRLEGDLEISGVCHIAASRGAEAATAHVVRSLRKVGVEAICSGDRPARVRLALAPDESLEPQAYRLRIEDDGIDLLAATPAGLFHGVVTLGQWLRLHGELEGGRLRVPRVAIHDAPEIGARAFLLDISRNRVPRLDTLFELVELLAELKYNQLQLYTEHTFAYRGHEVVWREASPLTAEDVRELDRFCRDRFVELVPNQNTLGHFHRWLVHEPYRRLAERPEGVEHAFGRTVEPFSLCPTDSGSLELIEDLLEQLLPHFSSSQVNVGMDETFDLGTGRSRDACEAQGFGELYLGFLRRVQSVAAGWGRRMQFWGDVVLAHPELLEQLPEDVVVLAWGYEHDHPFAAESARLAAAGLPFYVCPGTSSWNSLGGRRLDNALENLQSAADAAREHGADGYLVADWGDFGHLQPLPISYIPLFAGAGLAWSGRTASGLELRRLLRRHVPGSRTPPSSPHSRRSDSFIARLGSPFATAAFSSACWRTPTRTSSTNATSA